MRYSLQERFDILETYLSCNKHQWESVREYRRRFPERNCPSRKTFVSIAEKCRVHKSLMDRKRKKRHPKLTPDQQLDVLLYFQEFPKSSLRKAELALRIPRSSINKVLKDNKLKPFKVLPTQKLLPQDYEKRIRFCESMLQMNEEDHNFLNSIFWTDESSFSTAGIHNRKNYHIYAFENPHASREIRIQGRQTANLWCGVYKEKVYGPIFIEGALNGASYLEMLNETVENFIDENVPILQRANIIWQQDGAPPHNTLLVREFLNNKYRVWIGASGPIAWPPRSPDLSPLDFYLWGAITDFVNERDCENLQELKNYIQDKIIEINQDPLVFERVRQNFLRRCRLCLQKNGGRFENVKI